VGGFQSSAPGGNGRSAFPMSGRPPFGSSSSVFAGTSGSGPGDSSEAKATTTKKRVQMTVAKDFMVKFAGEVFIV